MTRSNAQRLMLGCGVAALGAAAVFWVLSMAAANAGPKGPESPPAPAVAGGPAVDALARIELGESTELFALDAGDCLIFLLNDGSERRYFFEAGIYVDGDVRRTVDSGAGELAQALGYVRESSVEEAEQ